MCIAGAGLVGLTLARALLQRGAAVEVYEAGAPGGGASGAAAGMLGATHEAGNCGSAALIALGFDAAAAWPGYAGMLERESGIALHYQPGPTLALARSEAEAGALERVQGCGRAGVRPVDPHCVMPGVMPVPSEAVLAAAWMPADGQVEPAAVVAALLLSVEALGGRVRAGEALDPVRGGFPKGVEVLVDARGWQAAGARPVKGAALALRPGPGLPSEHCVRFGSLYLVPRRGRVILGASVEPGLCDTQPSAGELLALVEAAGALFPAVHEAQVLARWAGVRPGSLVDGPVAGWIAPGRYLLTGHHRNGVLLAPLTAEAAARHILEGAALPEGLADAAVLDGRAVALHIWRDGRDAGPDRS